MILFQKRLNIFDFFGLVEKCNYPRKDKDLMEITENWDSTYYIFKKGLSGQQSKEIKDILENLETRVDEVFSRNRLGKIDFWSLYAVYLEEVNKKVVISFGLENIRSKEAMSFSINI